MTQVLPTLLLMALPASGKSEIRRYFDWLDPEQAALDFGLGRSIQLDDYPYVHLMRRISEELRSSGGAPLFFGSDSTPFLDAADWGTLIELLNEDFAGLDGQREPEPSSAAEWLLERLERARRLVGLQPPLDLPGGVRDDLARAIEADARQLWRDRQQTIGERLLGATVVIEFARGGPEGAPLPLPDPHGYRYALSRLSNEILAEASILYVWVTPEESRRRNLERAHPGIDGDASILHHGVPETVMRQDYGTDDMMWLIEQSDRPGTVRVEAHGREYHLPIAVFDNRTDHTSFLRTDPDTWPIEAIAELHQQLHETFGRF